MYAYMGTHASLAMLLCTVDLLVSSQASHRDLALESHVTEQQLLIDRRLAVLPLHPEQNHGDDLLMCCFDQAGTLWPSVASLDLMTRHVEQ